jgi:hypothetical protein
MKLSGKFQVVEIKKKTAAEFFKGLKVGDEFELVYNLNGTYHGAPSVDIYKDGQYAHSNNSLQLKTNLEKFKLKQI